MMRFPWVTVGVWVLAFSACQQPAVSPSAQLVGTREMVRVGRYIFTASTERNELKVLDLESGDSSVPRKFVRGPNPIHTLSIPVVDRPSLLATDVFYGAVDEIQGPYVYAASPGISAISIVWAEEAGENEKPVLPGHFTEVRRLATAAPVTALSARGGMPTDGRPVPDTLYFATYDGLQSTVYSLKVLPPATLPQELVPQALQTFDQPIDDVAALPDGRLAVALRKTPKADGRTLVLAADAAGATTTPMAFPAPVRQLHVNPNYLAGDVVIPAGARLYGVLDESACGSKDCGGVAVVDTLSGESAVTVTGLDGGRDPRVLQFEGGLIQSLALGAHAQVPLPVTFLPDAGVAALLGAATLSTGQVTLFLADQLRHIDTDTNAPSMVRSYLQFPDGGTGATFDAGPGFVSNEAPFGSGDVIDERIVVIGQGVIPKLSTLVPDGGLFLSTSAIDHARLGDRVVGCDGQPDVAIVEVLQDGIRLENSCSGGNVAVRVGEGSYTLVSTAYGYIGRAFNDKTFDLPMRYITNGVWKVGPGKSATLDFASARKLQKDEQFVIDIENAYAPLVMGLNSSNCFTALPGTVLIDSTPRQRLFIAYPSANGIVEFDTTYAARGNGLIAGVLCWR